jgi:hypothetical protein
VIVQSILPELGPNIWPKEILPEPEYIVQEEKPIRFSEKQDFRAL